MQIQVVAFALYASTSHFTFRLESISSQGLLFTSTANARFFWVTVHSSISDPFTSLITHMLEPVCRWTFAEKGLIVGWSGSDRSFYSIVSITLTAPYLSRVIMSAPGWQVLHRRTHQHEVRYSVGLNHQFSSGCQACQARHNTLLYPTNTTHTHTHTHTHTPVKAIHTPALGCTEPVAAVVWVIMWKSHRLH